MTNKMSDGTIYLDRWGYYFIAIALSPYFGDLIMRFFPNLDDSLKIIIFYVYSKLAPGLYLEVRNTLLLVDANAAKRYIYAIIASDICLIVLTCHFLITTTKKFNNTISIKTEVVIFFIFLILFIGWCTIGLYTFPPKVSRRLNFSDGYFSLRIHAVIFPFWFLPILTQIISISIRLVRQKLDFNIGGTHEQ